MESEYFKFGVSIGAIARGVTMDEILQKKATVDTITNHKEPAYGAVQRLVCKYAAEAYKESGKMTSFNYHVFNKLASTKDWWPTLDPYYEAATIAIGKVHSDIRKEAADLQKEAMFEKKAINLFTNMASGIGKMSPEIIKSVIALGGLTGVAGGSTAWLANRGVQQDKPQIEAMKGKIDYYNQLTNEIESELRRRGGDVDSEEAEDIANDYL